MYIDGTIALSLLIVTLTCAMVGYCMVYFFKHIHNEEKRAKDKDLKSN